MSKVVIIKEIVFILLIIIDYCFIIIDDYLMIIIIDYWWLLLLTIIKKDCNKTNYSRSINKVIRPILNILFFVYDKISQAPKSTKKH